MAISVFSVILGTRPEIIKLAPVIHEARRRGHQVKIIFTGQHRELAHSLFEFFGIRPDVALNVMSPNQGLTGLSSRILAEMDAKRSEILCDLMIVQGDTSSAFIAAYWAFCNHLQIAHVEAGLRTYCLEAPFPEEGNRQLISRIAKWHFAPTLQSAQFLKEEGISEEKIHQVGNTGIDSILYVIKQLDENKIQGSFQLPREILDFARSGHCILVTAHRRESFGEEMRNICLGIRAVADQRSDVRIVFPVHPNPNVREAAKKVLNGHPRVLLCEPLPYVPFVCLMKESKVILTDSGGIQEEGPSLGKTVLVMRSQTERPEGVQQGLARLVGTHPFKIQEGVLRALKEELTQGEQETRRIKNPYGDGRASDRIIEILEKGDSEVPLISSWAS